MAEKRTTSTPRERTSSAFRSIEQYAQKDVERAALLSAADPHKMQSTEISDSDNDPVIPAGSKVFFRALDLARIRRGRFVFVRRGGAVFARRLIRRDVKRGEVFMHLATADGRVLEPPLPSANLLGEIVKVDSGVRTFDPARPRSPFEALRHFLTDWGTCSPTQKLGRMLLAVVPPGMRRKTS